MFTWFKVTKNHVEQKDHVVVNHPDVVFFNDLAICRVTAICHVVAKNHVIHIISHISKFRLNVKSVGDKVIVKIFFLCNVIVFLIIHGTISLVKISRGCSL